MKDTIIKVIRDLSAKKLQEDNTPEAWLKKTLTKKELKHIKVKYFRKGILGLNVDSSSWIYTLNLKKEALLKKFQQCCAALKDIRFTLGE
ncbi:MAG: DciA family protein [Candidatus Omnitrophota bacterium]